MLKNYEIRIAKADRDIKALENIYKKKVSDLDSNLRVEKERSDGL